MKGMSQVKPIAMHPEEYAGSMDLSRAEIPGCIDRFTFEERLAYLWKYGTHCLSFSLLQQGMHYFDVPGIGFIFFDPLYIDNRIIGYVPNISRFSNKFKQGIFYPLMIHAMDTFKHEGVKYLNLGLCPLVADDNDMPGESVILKRINRLLYNHGNWIFSFKGLYFTKSRFGGTESRIFGGTRQKLPARAFLSLIKLCNVF